VMRRKYKARQIFVVSIFIISIFLTSTPLFYNFNSIFTNSQNEDLNNKEIKDVSANSNPYLNDYYITGSGNDQQVRIYATNSSSSNINNQDYFDIPSMSSIDDTYLTNGDFNFTFQNNYTTSHVMENTYPLNATSFINFKMNTGVGHSSVALANGSGSLNLASLTDNKLSTYSFISAENGIINLTLAADFSNTKFINSLAGINVGFNRSWIIGFNASLIFDISRNATLTIMMKDIKSSTWINVTDPIFLDSTSGTLDIEQKIVNENLKYINLTNVNNVQFYFRRFDTSNYNITLHELQDRSLYGFDLPITNKKCVALEFDLRGMSSTVNGFSAWIRTLNLTRALNAELNISLYKANRTVARTSVNLRTNTMRPEYSEMIDSFILDYNAYHGDYISYFKFNTSNTSNLGLYNYFIVIKSNSSDLVYSLATIPRESYGDPDEKIDHQLKMSSNNGSTWVNAYRIIPTSYQSEQLDASPFSLNVTRGYMPTDFYISEDDNLNIQSIQVENLAISTGIYATSSALTWGLGRWNNNFTTDITNNTVNDFRIDLNWNKTVIKGFQFNVTYFATAYWKEPALLSYNVSYNTIPRWQFNFTFDSNNANFNQWNFYEFWFVYPQYFDATNLTSPSSGDIYNLTGGEVALPNVPLDKTVVNSTLATSGIYILDATSPNIINDMHSYIDYYGDLLETNGFMYGDNMTVRLDILDQDGKFPRGGLANVSLFYPNNSTKFPGTDRSSSDAIKIDNTKTYSFNNDTILAVNEAFPLNNYYLGFFWFNGSAIGCKTLKVYIKPYEIQLDDLFYEPKFNVNVLSGIVSKVYDNYSLLLATVNETTGVTSPDFYAVNQSDLNQEYSIDVSGNSIPIMLKSFLQNETVLNPGETVKFSSIIQNLDELINLDVSVNIKLVALGNENWIIDETTSPIQTLALKGDPSGSDTKKFSVDLHIPDFGPNGTWRGLNAPIRKGGAKTIVTIYIGNKIAGVYKSPDYSILINDHEDVFEGYIVGLKYDTGITSESIIKSFQRDECAYLPESTKIFANIYDVNLLSSYAQYNKSFDLKLNSQFNDIITNPETPIRGETFNLTTLLTSEFGTPLENENVTVQYYDQNNWINLTSQLTGINGTLLFSIDSLNLNEEDNHLFRFSWLGTQFVSGTTENFTVNIYRQLNLVSLDLIQNDVQIYRNDMTTFNLRITNIGESTLKITDLVFNIEPDLDYQIVKINNLELNHLTPNNSTLLILEVKTSDIRQFSISLSVDAQNIFTLENATFNTSKNFTTFEKPLSYFFQEAIALIIFAIFACVAIITYLIVRRSIRVIETPIEEPVEKKRRRGRYLPVAEISKEAEEEEKEESKTDLDSLLEEEGLKDKDE
jgi:hypothetical protein